MKEACNNQPEKSQKSGVTIQGQSLDKTNLVK